MSDTTIVHLLRHGEVENPHGVMYGRLPGYHLSAQGRLMALAAADFFAERPVVSLFCSPLERAQETAQPVAERLGLNIVTDQRLIESTNHFEGLTFGVGDGSLRRPEHWRYLINPCRSGLRQPSAAHLRHPADGRGQAVVAQPGRPRVRAGQRDQLYLFG